MKQLTYLAVDLGCLLVPFCFSFHAKRNFYREWQYFLPANTLITLLFLIWDYYFTHWGIWGFNREYLCGIYLLNLPLEEILFFICIPYACVFSHFVLPYLLPKDPFSQKTQQSVFIILGVVLLLAAIYFYGKIYTQITFVLLGGYITVRGLWGDRFSRKYDLLSYLLIIPFFILSNGILTGTGIEQPIVWYNKNEIIGWRILSIPIEDTMYGWLLILLNIDLYHYFKKSKKIHT